MIRVLLLLFLFALPAFAQKNVYEAKMCGGSPCWTSPVTPSEPWGSQGNGGGTWTMLLNQPQTCISIPIGAAIAPGSSKVCVGDAHGNLHVMDFGGGPFLIDDEGYVFRVWSAAEIFIPEFEVRTFANGVH